MKVTDQSIHNINTVHLNCLNFHDSWSRCRSQLEISVAYLILLFTMTGSLGFGLLGLLAGQAIAQSANIITDDSYFAGQSPPSYPSPNATGTGAWADAYVKARALVSQLTVEEKVHHSVFPFKLPPKLPPYLSQDDPFKCPAQRPHTLTPHPPQVNLTGGVSSTTTGCSGTIAALPRVNFPGLCLSDAGNGLRSADLVTAWASGWSVGASWNRELARQRAVGMAGEFRRKGSNIALGPVVGPLGRTAASGRNWEGFAADPYLCGQLAFETVVGTQSQGIITSVKVCVCAGWNDVRRSWLTFGGDSTLLGMSKRRTGIPRGISRLSRLISTTRRCMSCISGMRTLHSSLGSSLTWAVYQAVRRYPPRWRRQHHVQLQPRQQLIRLRQQPHAQPPPEDRARLPRLVSFFTIGDGSEF